MKLGSKIIFALPAFLLSLPAGYSATTCTDIKLAAGNHTQGFSGDGGQATSAELSQPTGVAYDSVNKLLYIADSFNNRVRKVVLSTGVITTYAGNGNEGYSGDGGQATNAELDIPTSLALDSAGNLYIADSNNNVIRKVTKASGIISTFAGDGTAGYTGDGGLAVDATMNHPVGISFDGGGNLYIADEFNEVIRRIDVTSKNILTAVGNGNQGSSGDGGPAKNAEMWQPTGVSADTAGDLFISDLGNNKVRKVKVISDTLNTYTGTISTVAGTGTAGFSGNGGLAVDAELKEPQGIATNSTGTEFYVSDWGNSQIRYVNLTSGDITAYAGNGTLGYKTNVLAIDAELDKPGTVVYGSGGMYIADGYNQVVQVTYQGTICN